jgi:hypothetical protein
LLAQLRKFLQKVNPELTCLSLRRGGLQRMALEGYSTETLLTHSRHQRLENLHRYLNWGEVFLNAAREKYRTRPLEVHAQYNLSRAGQAIHAEELDAFAELGIQDLGAM